MEVNGKNIRGKGKSSLNLSSPTPFQVLEYLKKIIKVTKFPVLLFSHSNNLNCHYQRVCELSMIG